MMDALVATIGVYDMLHPGHLDFLESAAAYGSMLYVGIPSDALVEKIKGRRPVMTEEERRRMLQALRLVDAAFILRTTDYAGWLEDVEADILALGEEHVAERFELAAYAVEKRGGQAVRIMRSELCSTTELVKRVVEARG